MYDVFLGGIKDDTCLQWRKIFKENISNDITIYDSVENGGNNKDSDQKMNNKIGEELFQLDHSKIGVFYFNGKAKIKSNAILELGNAAGQGKPIIVGIEDTNDDLNVRQIKSWCEGCGIPVVVGLENLVWSTEEYLAEMELCKDVEKYNSDNEEKTNSRNRRGSNNHLRNQCGVRSEESNLHRVSAGRFGKPTSGRTCI